MHSTIEEEIFYPAFERALEKREDEKLLLEARQEHHVVDMVLPEVNQADVTSVDFAAKAKVLKDLIEHHAKEEEKQMFPHARKMMERSELQELGAKMERRKKELMAKTTPSARR